MADDPFMDRGQWFDPVSEPVPEPKPVVAWMVGGPADGRCLLIERDPEPLTVEFPHAGTGTEFYDLAEKIGDQYAYTWRPAL